MSHHEKQDPERVEIITQEDLFAAQIAEKFVYTTWHKIYRAMVEGTPVSPGELAIAKGWIPGDHLVVTEQDNLNELQRLQRAITYHERALARLKEQQKELRRRDLNLFSLAARQFA